VRDLLIKAGLDPARINVRAAGNEDRLAQCSTPLCRAENRNAEVFINDLRDREPRRSSIQRTDGSETSMVPSAAEAGVSSEMPQ
jgi:peptidoglycan-associated lipoprotein